VLDLSGQGGEPVAVSVGPEIEVMDMPLFSPDGRTIYFSAADPAGVAPGASLLERLFGVTVAQAHNVPSDWWRVPLEGGAAERLTEIGGIGLYGDFSPDGSRMAFISNTGVHVMNPDGSGLDTLIAADGFFGTIDWVP
jgi:TolB protein